MLQIPHSLEFKRAKIRRMWLYTNKVMLQIFSIKQNTNKGSNYIILGDLAKAVLLTCRKAKGCRDVF